METPVIPIVVLAGSDRRAVDLPDSGRDRHALTGYKSVEVTIGHEPLIRRVTRNLELSGCFSPVYVAGPARIHRDRVGDARLIDTDGTFGENIRHAIEHVRPLHPATPVAVTVCDVVPDPRGLQALARAWADSMPCDLWFPVVRAGSRERLGTSDWKPTYGIVERSGEPATRVLPGHLVVADLGALRLKFLYRLLDLGYLTRNRSIDERRSVMVRGLLRDMLKQDLLKMIRLRPPTMTWSVLRASIPASDLLRKGEITQRRLEDTLRRIFVKRRHRRRFPDRRVRVPIVDALFLARDIDTVEEAKEFDLRG
jgi:hypothetical protein